MVRLACISLPTIDLQMLALRNPELRRLPTVVVTEERPLGRITAANRAARAAGVEPGMRYASALGICAHLRAGVVDPQQRADLRDRLVGLLHSYSPRVEPAADDPALYWVDAGGLEHLYPSPQHWAQSIRGAIEQEGLVCGIAVGCTRFGTYAAAKAKRQITLFDREDEERSAAMGAPLGVLPLDHEVLLRCRRLGVVTVGDLCAFAPGALRRRFGAEVERLQRFAKGEAEMPLQSVDEPDAMRREMRLLYPQDSMDALLRYQLSLLRELVAHAWSRQRLVSRIVMEFHAERWGEEPDAPCREEILTAQPTSDQRVLERLITLRMEHLRLPAPVVRIRLEVALLPPERGQHDLFVVPRRDPAKALAAIAEVCAELGNDAVQIAVLEETHLPQASYRWRRVERLALPGPADEASIRPLLARRVLHAPLPLSQPRFDRDGPLAGPYEISGGWWQHPYRRDYFYLRDRSGRLIWVYRAVSGQWFVQGVVE